MIALELGTQLNIRKEYDPIVNSIELQLRIMIKVVIAHIIYLGLALPSQIWIRMLHL